MENKIYQTSAVKSNLENFYNFKQELIYRMRNICGYLLGKIAHIKGYVNYECNIRPFIVGWKTELKIRPGSKITLSDISNRNSNGYLNNTVFPTASSLGVRAHYNELDPPVNDISRIELLGKSSLVLGQNVAVLTGAYITGSSNTTITVGKNTYISQEVVINSRAGINIGENVLIGNQVRIMDYDAHLVMSENQQEKNYTSIGSKQGEIIIEDNVWIGFRATILKGVRIGRGAIIAANSCVVRDIPRNVIAAGNPAKVVKENVTWKR